MSEDTHAPVESTSEIPISVKTLIKNNMETIKEKIAVHVMKATRLQKMNEMLQILIILISSSLATSLFSLQNDHVKLLAIILGSINFVISSLSTYLNLERLCSSHRTSARLYNEVLRTATQRLLKKETLDYDDLYSDIETSCSIIRVYEELG